ncbi:MAG: diaminopimelate epimerase [Gammaproteobacteria bacterium]|nr:diaminopimelate epimerase [Gammaproteobacteria bacterium]
MKLRFAKMHGLGNDFMVVDLVTQRGMPTPDQVRSWSDRRTGVGFDQLLAVLPPGDPHADFRMGIFNADGSQAEQCGNGARCFAQFVVEEELTVKRDLLVETEGGNIRTELLDNGQVRVDMGVPSTAPEKVPFLAEEARTSYVIDVGDSSVEVTPVSVGNPHAVVFVNNVARADIDGIGSALQHHERFPEQVNVGFLQIVDRRFARLRVYERGTGETRACGTGACAAMVAARLHDRLEARAKISLPGGKLRLEWQGRGSPATLSGSAKLVFTGRIEL